MRKDVNVRSRPTPAWCAQKAADRSSQPEQQAPTTVMGRACALMHSLAINQQAVLQESSEVEEERTSTSSSTTFTTIERTWNTKDTETSRTTSYCETPEKKFKIVYLG